MRYFPAHFAFHSSGISKCMWLHSCWCPHFNSHVSILFSPGDLPYRSLDISLLHLHHFTSFFPSISSFSSTSVLLFSSCTSLSFSSSFPCSVLHIFLQCFMNYFVFGHFYLLFLLFWFWVLIFCPSRLSSTRFSSAYILHIYLYSTHLSILLLFRNYRLNFC